MEIDNIIQNVQEIIDEKSFRVKLESGKKLRIKFGADPSRPDLHIGHAVALKKLKEFQDLGHTVIFLIGDYTARIGDPSGRNTTRPVLSVEEIEQNTKTYLDQVGKVLDLDKCEIRRNSEWFSKMTFADILSLLGKVTLKNIIEREDFKNRIAENQEIAMHELLYPVMQGYDSVVLEADVELGGQDQKLNLLMGRDIQKRMGQAPQDIVTVPLLVGTDGKRKMSKSYDNYIGISEAPEQQFGKIMSIPDEAIGDYLKLVSSFSPTEIEKMMKGIADGGNPRDVKESLAKNIVALFNDESAANLAVAHFDKVVRQRQMPDQVEEYRVTDSNNIVDILIGAGLAQSKSQARRLIEQGAVRVDGDSIDNLEKTIDKNGSIINVGKRSYVRIIVDDQR